jgi:hypothetical protein
MTSHAMMQSNAPLGTFGSEASLLCPACTGYEKQARPGEPIRLARDSE